MGQEPTRQTEDGQSLAVIAIFMVAFVMMMGVVLDSGLGYARYRQMQTAADTAALSGAKALAEGAGTGVASQRIEKILADNGASLTDSTYTIDGANVSVTARLPVDTLVSGMVGLSQFTVAARSQAAFGAVTSMDNLIPIAVPEAWWEPGQSVTLFDSDREDEDHGDEEHCHGDEDHGDEDHGHGDEEHCHEDEDSPGNWGWLRWNCTSGNLKTYVEHPETSPEISVDDWECAKPGMNTSALKAMKAWIGQEVTLVLYDNTNNGQGANLKYHVSGFARFRVTEVQTQGNRKYIRGEFVSYVTVGGEISTSGRSGVMSVGLAQ